MTLGCSSDVTVAVNVVLRVQNKVKSNLVLSNFVFLNIGYEILLLKRLSCKYMIRKLPFLGILGVKMLLPCILVLSSACLSCFCNSK